MILNGKKFKITAKAKIGLVEELEQADSLTKEKTMEFVKQVLQPTPNDEDLEELDFEQYLDIFLGFKQALERKITQIKKKLSL
jgi:hypothetical protein